MFLLIFPDIIDGQQNMGKDTLKQFPEDYEQVNELARNVEARKFVH